MDFFKFLILFIATIRSASAQPHDSYDAYDDGDDISLYAADADVEDVANPDDEHQVKLNYVGSALDSGSSLGGGSVDINSLPLLDWRKATVKDFWFEALMLFGLAVYVIAYSSGKAKNKNIARTWLKCHLDTWKDNFAHVGDDKGFKLTEDGPRDYIMYGSGRRFCKYVYANIHLKPRHDLLQWALEYISLATGSADPSTYSDRVTINVTLNDEESDGIILAVLPRSKAASTTKNRWDLDNFTKPKDYPDFPKEDYVLLTDCGEFAIAFWALESVKKALLASIVGEDGKKNDKLIIEQITLSDLPFTEPEDLDGLSPGKSLQFIFNIPQDLLEDSPSRATLSYQTLLSTLVFDVIDLIGTHGCLSPDAQTRAKKLRVAAQASIMKKGEEKRRQELAEKKYAEKVAKENAIVNLAPEAQRKAEEKIRKQEAKKQNKNRVKRVQS